MIYEIVCNVTGERYIGSTFKPIQERIQGHKQASKRNSSISSRHIINRNDYTYSILENVDTDSKDELRQCELKWYNQLENINKNAPYADKKAYNKAYHKQWYEDNKTAKLLKSKEYNKQNAEKLKEYQREYYKTSTQIKMSA
jgi:hypothetical protein